MSEQNTPISLLEELYYSWSKKKAIAIEPLPESGSYRRYFRITGGRTNGHGRLQYG